MKKQEKNLTEIVKRKLWKFGYRVNDYSEVEPVDFDLLIDNKIRVKVGMGVPKKLPEKCDVFASVNGTGEVKFIVKPPQEGLVQFKSPYEVFGRPKKVEV